MAAAKGITKYATDGFSSVLANVLEERLARIKQYVDEDKACTRDELSRFIWGTARSVRQTIKPEETDPRRREAWQAAKGMLKELIDFDKFRPQQYHAPCVKNVLEKKTAEVIDNYRLYVMTGEVRTRWFPPKLLGETDEILCIDKPCLYTCTYGGSKDDLSPPPLAGVESASMLLNGEKPEIQIHEYLALKYQYETAVGTREWWKKGEKQISCYCGACAYCSCTQSGCCNRLDKETSGVMICAKTIAGFPEIRKQFSSEHSLEKGGTEKYYLALAHGEVQLPKQEEKKSQHWKHSTVEGRGRVEVTMKWSKEHFKSMAYDAGEGPSGSESPQWALTLYEPLAWFSDSKNKEKFTLVHVQIVTGRTHQIRFHLAEVGHSLVGDPTYGAPWKDREWAKRVFLHSYQTKFREPFTLRWFEATSPLPPDLGQVLAGLKLERVKNPWTGDLYLSRRKHPELETFLKQYDPTKPLLFSRDAPTSAAAIEAAKGQMSGPPLVAAHLAPEVSPHGWTGNWDANGWKADSWKAGDTWDWKDGAWVEGGNKEDDKAKAADNKDKGKEEDDDDWGGWGSKAEEPPAKRPRTEEFMQDAPKQEVKQQEVPAKPEVAAANQVLVTTGGRLPTTPPMAAAAVPMAKAKWKRIESRSQQGVFYYFNEATGETRVEPPLPWEKRQSRSQAGVFYYWNSQTNATSVTKPELV